MRQVICKRSRTCAGLTFPGGRKRIFGAWNTSCAVAIAFGARAAHLAGGPCGRELIGTVHHIWCFAVSADSAPGRECAPKAGHTRLAVTVGGTWLGPGITDVSFYTIGAACSVWLKDSALCTAATCSERIPRAAGWASAAAVATFAVRACGAAVAAAVGSHLALVDVLAFGATAAIVPVWARAAAHHLRPKHSRLRKCATC